MEKVYTFSTPALYTFDPSVLEVRNGDAELKKSYADPVNQAFGLTVTSMSSAALDLDKITNGNFNSWCDLGSTPPYDVQIDLGIVKTIRLIKLYRPWQSNRVYSNTVIQISEDGINYFTIFNNDSANLCGQGVGTQATYIESESGHSFLVSNINAQYVRVWTGADNLGGDPAIVELEVYQTTYSTEPQHLKTNEIVTANVLTSLVATTTLSGGTIKYNVIVNNIEYWWDGAYFVPIETPDYFKSNSLVEITSNWAQFVETMAPNYFQFRIWFLAPPDGLDTPLIDDMTFTFSLDQESIPKAATRLGFGYMYDSNGSPVDGMVVSASLNGASRSQTYYDDGLGNAVFLKTLEMQTVTNQYGYFSFPFILTNRLYNSPGVPLTTAKWYLRTASGVVKSFTVDDGSMAPFNILTI
jgi:hypothetical protein